MPSRTALPWCLGLTLAGWGLSILTGIVPHEDLLVGAALLGLGAAVAVSGRQVPELPVLPRWLYAGLGALLVTGGALGLARGWDPPKLAVAVVGILLASAAALHGRSIGVGRARMPAHAAAFSLLPFALGPVAVYVIQGLTHSATGGSPLELFLEYGLVVPLAAAVGALGWSPARDGHFLTYATPSGPLRLEVGVACSGIQAMALFAGMLAILLAVHRPPPRTALRLAVVGLAGVYAVNLLRLLGLTVVGYHWGVDALEQAHAQGGWILFVAWALAFAAWARRSLPSRASAEAGAGPARTAR